MSVFEAVFVRVDGLAEKEIEFRPLAAGTLNEASEEALNIAAPTDANLIKILAGGHLAQKIGIAL